MSRSQNVRVTDSLCICEYNDVKGQKSHLLAACCDCEALDLVCDRFLTCKSVPDEAVERMFATVEDRCRVPWFGGAVRVSLDVAFPVIVVPSGLLLATYGPFWTKLVLSGFPLLLLAFYRNWVRRPKRQRTRVFYVWGLVSTGQMYYTYVTIVVGFREVLLWETMFLTTLFFLMFYCLYLAKKDPGVVVVGRQELSEYSGISDPEGSPGSGRDPRKEDSQSQEPIIAEHEVTWVDSRHIKDGRLETRCVACNITKPLRSGHCPLCKVCIRLRDHHCVWIDACIGQLNHRAFVAALSLCIITGTYGAHLTMTTVCTPEMYLDWFLWPADCRFVYADFPTAISYVSACYTYVAVFGLSLLLVQQLTLIGQNLTSQELRSARLHGWTRFVFFVVGRKNANDRGFLQNWIEFVAGPRRERCVATMTMSSTVV